MRKFVGTFNGFSIKITQEPGRIGELDIFDIFSGETIHRTGEFDELMYFANVIIND